MYTYDKVSNRINELKCIVCSDIAVVIVHTPKGCTCLDNKYQPRCMQHLLRLNDSCDNYEVIEDFRIGP